MNKTNQLKEHITWFACQMRVAEAKKCKGAKQKMRDRNKLWTNVVCLPQGQP